MSKQAHLVAAPGQKKSAGQGPLTTLEQTAAEQLVLRVAGAPQIAAVKAALRTELLALPEGQTPDGAARLDRALDLWGRSLALQHAGSSTEDPSFLWDVDETPRSISGYEWPGSGVGGLGNPDNIYRSAYIDGASSYEVIGQRATPASGYFSLEVNRQEPGRLELIPVKGNEADLGNQVGILTISDVKIEPDLSFRITIGPDAPSDGKSHIHTKNGSLTIVHRDTLTHWDQVPNSLFVRKLSGPAGTGVPSESEIAERIAAGLPDYVKFWTAFRGFFMGNPAPNTVAGPVLRDGGWGLAAGGRFRLAEDEVFLVTTRGTDADYTGFQVADPWMMVGSNRDIQNSLNGSQITPNADGTITYAIAPKDPGLVNWLDTGGVKEGWFMLRWQWSGQRAQQTELVRSVEVLREPQISNLKNALGWISLSERAERIRKRQLDYGRRLGL